MGQWRGRTWAAKRSVRTRSCLRGHVPASDRASTAIVTPSAQAPGGFDLLEYTRTTGVEAGERTSN